MATSAKTTPPCRWLSLAHWRLMLAPARLDIVEPPGEEPGDVRRLGLSYTANMLNSGLAALAAT